MKILALIPARGGSKRLPGKNIKLLGGKPLIVWSIDVVKDVVDIVEVLISTDDEAIADIGKKAGASIPWLRPAALAADDSSSVDVALHALNWYEATYGAVDGLLLLQPTSPFRQTDTIFRGIDLFKSSNLQAVVGVSPVRDHPLWTLKLESGRLVPYVSQHGLNLRSQDLPPAYCVNGAFYLIAPKQLRETRLFGGTNAIPLLMDSPRESLDIDTEWDWLIAQCAASSVERF